MKEAERQISYEKSYEEIRITKKEKVDLVEKSNKVLSNLRTNYVITGNETTILDLILKKAIQLSFICFLEYTKVFLRYLSDQSFPTVEPLLKKFQISWITIYSL